MEKRRYELPVRFDAFAIGSYSAVGHITLADQTLTFAGSTTSYPWALIVLPLLVLVEVVLLRGRNRMRRLYQRSSALASETGGPAMLLDIRLTSMRWSTPR